mmetsp:Transcript_2252/g.7140  ORF Transcript_2252/g.7140 Transcript_2252/m.7140 type:complete len:209 (+) Transcript_2252:746-1372(+)
MHERGCGRANRAQHAEQLEGVLVGGVDERASAVHFQHLVRVECTCEESHVRNAAREALARAADVQRAAGRAQRRGQLARDDLLAVHAEARGLLIEHAGHVVPAVRCERRGRDRLRANVLCAGRVGRLTGHLQLQLHAGAQREHTIAVVLLVVGAAHKHHRLVTGGVAGQSAVQPQPQRHRGATAVVAGQEAAHTHLCALMLETVEDQR